jgi:hypothetical protein
VPAGNDCTTCVDEDTTPTGSIVGANDADVAKLDVVANDALVTSTFATPPVKCADPVSSVIVPAPVIVPPVNPLPAVTEVTVPAPPVKFVLAPVPSAVMSQYPPRASPPCSNIRTLFWKTSIVTPLPVNVEFLHLHRRKSYWI